MSADANNFSLTLDLPMDELQAYEDQTADALGLSPAQRALRQKQLEHYRVTSRVKKVDGGLDRRKFNMANRATRGTHPLGFDGKSVFAPTIKRLSMRHEAIIDYIVANPTARMADIAIYFKVSRSWLSIVVNSDAFKQKLAERQDLLFQHTVVPLQEKIAGLAHVGLDKLGDVLENTQDPALIKSTTEGLLDRLGYSAKAVNAALNASPSNTQINNYYSVDSNVLAQARENFGKTLTEEKALVSATTEALPTSGSSRERTFVPDTAANPPAEKEA